MSLWPPNRGEREGFILPPKPPTLLIQCQGGTWQGPCCCHGARRSIRGEKGTRPDSQPGLG